MGHHQTRNRGEGEWSCATRPTLRIVSDDAWAAAHSRLQAAQRTYPAGTAGELWGRPATGLEAKYLLSGLSRCAVCGGSLLVKTRAHGRKRVARYGCSIYHHRGRAICGNALEMSMAAADDAMLDAIRDDILHPDVVREAVAEALRVLTTPTVAER